MSVVGLLASTLTGLATIAQSASAASPNCSFADASSGTYANTLCWFDLSSYDAAEATAGGQAMTMNIPGGYTLSFTLTVSGGPVVAASLPTYSAAFLGRGGYTGIAGDPALYQTANGTTTTATLSAITVTNSGGTVVHGYSLVGADAESSDNSESLTWTSSNPLSSLEPIGNACAGGFTGVGTTSVTCTGKSDGTKTGAAILASEAPTSFSQQMVGGGLQGVAFGVFISQLELNKTVVNGLGTDSFGLSVADAGGSVLGTANTDGGSSASTGVIAVLAGTDGEQYTLSESATVGTLANYDESWSCTRNGSPDATLPSGAAGASANVTLDIGDFVDCTITNTAKSTSLDLTKHAAVPVDVNHDGLTDAGDTIAYSFTVTNNGALTIDNVGITDAKAGSVTCPQPTLASGDSETCTADTPYTITAADVTAGAVTNTATASGTVSGSTATVTSPSSSTTTPTTAPDPSLTLQKSASPTSVSTSGQTVTYSFLVKNTGNVTMTGVAVAETAFSGTGTPSAVTCPGGAPSLAPNATVTCTATYDVTQADLDAGSVSNTADATGIDPVGALITSPTSTVTVSVNANPALSVVKSVSPISATTAGQLLTYSFVITNTGNLTLTNAGINEGAFTGSGTMSAPTCPAGAAAMAPGAQVTCTATYTVTQTDIDNGTVTNTATASASPPPGVTGPTVSAPSTVTMPEPASPSLSIGKSVLPTTVTAAGQTLNYSFLVTNTGNVTMHGVTVNETGFTGSGTLSTISCPAGAASMAPGAAVTCTASYTVTQADMDAGSVSNTATASGTDPSGASHTSAPSTAVATVTDSPALTIKKSALPTTVSTAGQTITYSFLVKNTGNVTIHGIAVDEGSFSGSGTLSAVTCPGGAPQLAPSATVTCTATYDVTQADLDAGSVTNSATASGLDPGGSSVDAPSSSVTVLANTTPALTLVKSVLPTTVSAAGQTVTYSFTVTNTGDVTVTGVGIDEGTFSGSGSLSAVTCPGGAAVLAPTASVTCTATYDVTQADLDAGSISNSATATGSDPTAAPVTSPTSTATLSVSGAPGLTVTKSVFPTSVSTAGQLVTYSFQVTNTGNLTLHAITINEGAFSGTGTLGPASCPAGSLAPGASVTCTADYTVTQADLDAGSVTNTATASGTDPGNTTHTSSSSSATLSVVAAPGLSLVKTALPTAVSAVGQTVTYSFLVTNTGNVTIHGIAIDEGAFSGTGTLSAVDCPAGPLAPDASVTCTGTYDVTQADLDAGSISNTATASGTDSGGEPVSSAGSTATVSVTANPALSLVKSASPVGPTTLHVGEVITYSFLVTNTGNVTLTDVAVDEGSFTGSGQLSAVSCPAGAASLAPGLSVTCTATYTVTQADVDAGTVLNTATATATPPVGLPSPSESAPSTAMMPAVALPALTVAKTVSPTAVTAAGQTLTYSFLVTNTGNVTLTGAAVNEGAFTGTGTLSAVDCPAGADSLIPGAQATCTATYTVTQADLDAGSVSNTATVSAAPPAGGSITSLPSTATATAPAAPGLSIVKTASPTTISSVGQTVTYEFVVTNTGNVTMTDIAVHDRGFTGSGRLGALSCPGTSLAPAATMTCTATYVVTQADIDAGSISNTAVASAHDPAGGGFRSPPSTATVRSTARSALGLRKSGHAVDVNQDGRIDAGDRVDWTVVATNLGATTITHIVVVDRSAGRPHCPQTGLAPGATMTCTVRSHTVTAADEAAGQVGNVATASGLVLGTTRVSSAPARATVRIGSTPLPGGRKRPRSGNPSLPFTGFGPTRDLVVDAGLLLMLGGLMLAVSRARRRQFSLPSPPSPVIGFGSLSPAVPVSWWGRLGRVRWRLWRGDSLLLWCLRRPA